MTPEEVARINQRIPGFAAMSPEQQEVILNRLQGNQQKQVSTVNNGSAVLPFAAQSGLQAITGQAAPTYAGTAASTATTASAGASGTAAATPAISTNPGLGGLVAGAYTGYQQAKGAQKLLQGKSTSTPQKAALFPITGGLDTIAEKTGLTKLLGGGKSKDQQGRDIDRATLKQGGILDEDYNLTLSDGSKVNLGLDGSVKNYNVDFNEKGIGDIVALVNPFAYLVTGGNQKRASDLAGQLTNAIKTSKNPQAEAKALFDKAGLYKSDVLSRIDQLNVDDQTKAVFKNTINNLGLQDVPQGNVGGVTGPQGFNITINTPKVPQPKVDKLGWLRNVVLSKLQETQKPIQYPTQAPNYSSTLSKIVGR